MITFKEVLKSELLKTKARCDVIETELDSLLGQTDMLTEQYEQLKHQTAYDFFDKTVVPESIQNRPGTRQKTLMKIKEVCDSCRMLSENGIYTFSARATEVDTMKNLIETLRNSLKTNTWNPGSPVSYTVSHEPMTEYVLNAHTVDLVVAADRYDNCRRRNRECLVATREKLKKIKKTFQVLEEEQDVILNNYLAAYSPLPKKRQEWAKIWTAGEEDA